MDEILICQLPPAPPARAQVCKWPGKEITWSIEGEVPPFNRSQLRDIYQKAWTIWERVCGIRSRYVESDAMVKMGSGRIDGPSNVLAWSEMPCDVNVRSVLQRFDTTERWTDSENPSSGTIDLVTVACHELGHAIGIPHIESGNILYAAYMGAKRVAGPGDIRESVLRYGPAIPAPGPDPDPAIPAWFVSFLRAISAWLAGYGGGKMSEFQQVPPSDWWKLFIAAVIEILKWLASRPSRAGELAEFLKKIKD